MSIFKDERTMLLEKMWEIVLRETGVEDDAGCDWFTIDHATYIGGIDWIVSEDKEVACLVDAINALNGLPEFINYREAKYSEEQS